MSGLRFVLWGLVAAVVGCKTSSKMLNTQHEGRFELAFHNEVGGAVCELHIFPEGEANEGSNWLAADQSIESGQASAYWLEPGVYQVHAVGCPWEPMLAEGYAPRVAMNTHGVFVLFREDVPTSKAEATRLAHDHHNATTIAAKLNVNKSPAKRPPPPAVPASGSSPRPRPAR